MVYKGLCWNSRASLGFIVYGWWGNSVYRAVTVILADRGTFSFQTSSRVARGLCFENAQQASQSPAVLENLKSAADELESQECFAIAGNCGFMHFYQDLIRDIVQVPVFMSALVQVPTMMAALEPEDRRSDMMFSAGLLCWFRV